MAGQYYEVYLSFGSNVGDREANIETALKFLDDADVKLIKFSSLYETEPLGNPNQPGFLNCAGIFDTSISATELITEILNIEKTMGRQRTEKWQPRIIDIDILFFGNEIVNENGLSIPHPEMQKRKFVLTPLAEIAPGFVHPVLKKSILTLLSECKDELKVAQITI